MTTLVSPPYEQRALLLEQLNTLWEREEQLHRALFELVAEELAVSRYVLEAQGAEDPAMVAAMVSEGVVEFHQRETTILNGLQEVHQEATRIFETLHTLGQPVSLNT